MIYQSFRQKQERPTRYPKKPSWLLIDAFSAKIRAIRKMFRQANWTRGTQIRRLNAIRASPLSLRPRLWLTFQPIPKEGRSILNGVGQAATSVEITREREPDCSPGSTCGTSQCYGLSSGTWRANHTPTLLESACSLGFFGEGMPVRAWVIAADAALAAG